MLPPEGRVGAGESGGTENVGCGGPSKTSPVDLATFPIGPKNGSRPWNHSKNFIILTQTRPTNQSRPNLGPLVLEWIAIQAILLAWIAR